METFIHASYLELRGCTWRNGTLPPVPCSSMCGKPYKTALKPTSAPTSRQHPSGEGHKAEGSTAAAPPGCRVLRRRAAAACMHLLCQPATSGAAALPGNSVLAWHHNNSTDQKHCAATAHPAASWPPADSHAARPPAPPHPEVLQLLSDWEAAKRSFNDVNSIKSWPTGKKL